MANAKEICLINAAGAWDPADFAFAAEAAQIQLKRDFEPAWRGFLPQPDEEMVVVGYTRTEDMAPGSFFAIEVLAALDDPGTLGDHGGIAELDQAFGRTLPDSTVATHEVLEMRADRYGDRWVRLPSGIVCALEVADPVEDDTYEIEATVGHVTRSVKVSNFVYPAWFGEGAGQKYDHMGLCKSPGENRGYLIVENADGTTSNVFADRMPEERKDLIEARQEAKRAMDARVGRRFASNIERKIVKIAPF